MRRRTIIVREGMPTWALILFEIIRLAIAIAILYALIHYAPYIQQHLK